ncbi:hypothetical protein [Mycolicibacterium sp. lyk4-40-TYG-92]|uniref:hypothetical protein n=1 Tax=Mycolicibacterium sp. lyk4-40-TYG-92 TaxID=3040295 RepID=UPI00254EF17A|nr:hypothetical protein [Mycolicibacterium sp. lyk4-40-TYG-92]
MTKYCVIPGPTGEPEEYPLGDYPRAEEDCRRTGGEVVDRTDIIDCGGTFATAPEFSPGSAGSRPVFSHLTDAALAPIRILRRQLPDSGFKNDLEAVNYSPEFVRILSEDAVLRAKAREVIGLASQFALLGLVDPSAGVLQQSQYTESLHSWLVELATMVRQRTDDERLHGALDRLVDVFEQRIGEPIGVLLASIRGDDRPPAEAL